LTRAACIGYPPDWWFPEERVPDPLHLEEVRAVCVSCPVRRECLDYALVADHVGPRGGHGIWAGLSEGQRMSLQRNVCVGCRRNEDPAALWGRMGNWRPTGVCDACDDLRARHLAEKQQSPATPPAVPEVVMATVEWWLNQRAALTR
jgi:WhiB family redox-sensing transcriptional regulator